MDPDKYKGADGKVDREKLNEEQKNAYDQAIKDGLDVNNPTVMNGILAAGAAGAAGAGMSATTAASVAAMEAANLAGTILTIASIKNQTLAAARSMVLQTVRDFIKDAKDTVKDMGEAAHKP